VRGPAAAVQGIRVLGRRTHTHRAPAAWRFQRREGRGVAVGQPLKESMMRWIAVLTAALALGASAATPVKVPPGHAVATFAGGCFWCMEPPYDKLPGLVAPIFGYQGGRTVNPSYEDVSSKMTGHAEAVQVVYDPKKVTYEKLLEV